MKTDRTADFMRPWLLGIPAFVVAVTFLMWSVARLASWVFVVLKANK